MTKSIFFSVFLMITFSVVGCTALTQNHAETTQDHPDPSLRTRTYPITYDDFFKAVLEILERLPRWEVLQSHPSTGVIHATRETRLFHFVDDVQIQVAKKGESEVTLNLRSASRVGKGDFGQNARNIRELLNELEK